MHVMLFSTGCPKCLVLEKKLQESGIEYVENNDVQTMIDRGFTTAPVLEVDGVSYSYKEAVKWIKER